MNDLNDHICGDDMLKEKNVFYQAVASCLTIFESLS